MRDELNWIENFIALERPLLGICLGAQLIARSSGARANRHADYEQEIGFRPIYPACSDSNFIPPGQLMFQWHNEGFELPEGAELLACGDLFPNQAFSYAGHVVGLQFHPEANHDVIECWHAAHQVESDQLNSEGSKAKHLQEAKQLDTPITQWLEGFLANWLVSSV